MSSPLHLPREFVTAGVTCGVKESGNRDLAMFVSRRACTSAGTFTQNRVAGAPVVVSRTRVPSESTRGIVINSGNANACTGEQGIADARRMTALVAEQTGTSEEQILVCSTGVIGHHLPMAKIERGIREAAAGLGDSPDHLQRAAQAMMTTDTVEKLAVRSFEHRGERVTVTGIAKGAAMIAPNMATMLAVILTDAEIPVTRISGMLAEAVSRSFNCISVDGHTSTSDSVLLLANGAAGVSCADAELEVGMQQTLNEICTNLAQQIIRDAEGAEHFVTVQVSGLPSAADAHRIAKAVCESALVKTAVTGNDPNWGRIVSAAGYAGVPFEEQDLSLELNGTLLYESGRPVGYEESAVSASMQSGEVSIRLRFRLGPAEATWWTSDLTAEYVRLNADYTT
jgi:glutamate N-acetyltransferase / amino-acid N-acetyltransferase